jgi:hypothetical protein
MAAFVIADRGISDRSGAVPPVGRQQAAGGTEHAFEPIQALLPPPSKEQPMSEAVVDWHQTIDAAHLSVVRRRAILSCAIGNFFELFDFTIYGYFAVAITRAFYPSGSMYGT